MYVIEKQQLNQKKKQNKPDSFHFNHLILLL